MESNDFERLSPQEVERHKREGLCYKCHKPGHRSNKCHANFTKQNKQSSPVSHNVEPKCNDKIEIIENKENGSKEMLSEPVPKVMKSELSVNDITNFIVPNDKLMYVHFEINGKIIYCLLDSGCTTNLISNKTIGTVELHNKIEPLNDGNPITLSAALPSVKTEILGKIQLNLGFHELKDPTRFYVVNELSKSIILGIPFVRKHRYEINFPDRTFYGRNVDGEILDIGNCNA